MKRILVIDDDPQLREMVSVMLAHAGYDVVDADDGREGIRLYRQQPADLVITDIFMPETEGLQVIRELRKEFPAVRVIAMSGGGNKIGEFPALPLAEQLGAMFVLQKPFLLEELLGVVRKALGAKEQDSLRKG
jgi:CheY-like chemotaxis protein